MSIATFIAQVNPREYAELLLENKKLRQDNEALRKENKRLMQTLSADKKALLIVKLPLYNRRATAVQLVEYDVKSFKHTTLRDLLVRDKKCNQNKGDNTDDKSMPQGFFGRTRSIPPNPTAETEEQTPRNSAE